MPPSKHICTQGDRISKIENLLDPEQGIVMDKLKHLDDGQIRIETKLDKFIESVDTKYVKKETFAVAVGVIGVIATILGILNIFNK